MPDSFTEITSESWFGRLGKSIMGILVGGLLIVGSAFLLYWNESRAVTTARSLKEGAGIVLSIQSDRVDPGNESKLIHLSGEAKTTQRVADPIFAVSADGLRLSRSVSMYQWTEHEKTEERKKLGGGTEKVHTYTYNREWTSKLVDSSQFRSADGHANPKSMLAEQFSVLAKPITLGAFTVSPEVTAKMHGDEPLSVTEADLAKLPPNFKGKAKLSEGGFYFGADPANPAVGDQKVTFTLLKPATYSILAQQVGSSFGAYQTRAGDALLRVESGSVGAKEMFAHAASENAVLTWVLRGVGFVLMSVGFGMIMGPLSVIGDVIPLVGNIIGAGVFMAAVGLGFVFSTITIAVAWIVVRPLLGIALIALAVGAIVLLKKSSRGSQPPPVPPGFIPQ